METYKSVVGYECLYQVSDLGNLKSLNYRGKGQTKVLKPTIKKDGYPVIKLRKDKMTKVFKVHVLMAQSFLGEKKKGFVADHKNGIRSDNRLGNIQYITFRANVVKGKICKSSKYVGVRFYPAKKESTKQYYSNIWADGKKKYLGNFHTEIEAHEAYQAELLKCN